MSETCNCIISRLNIAGIDSLSAREGEDWWCECLRPANHKGPHLIKRVERVGGQYVVWEQDCCEPGICDDCDGEDPEGYCLVYGFVSEEVACRLIADGSLES
ncbi:hypothetical protein K2P47_02535 [Patescibacteria group bacterium]|nr:hypothetical protein [Patescibacteria group bacterium]